MGLFNKKKVSNMIQTTPLSEKSIEERIYAAIRDGITDQNYLAAIVLEDEDFYKRSQKFLDRITEREWLERIARSAISQNARKSALERMDDPSLTAEIAVTDGSAYVRQSAVRMLTDESVLAHVAQNEKEEYIRLIAVEKLTDTSLLKTLSKGESSTAVRMAAAYILKDEALVYKLITEAMQNSKPNEIPFPNHCLYLLSDDSLVSLVLDCDEKTIRFAETIIDKIKRESYSPLIRDAERFNGIVDLAQNHEIRRLAYMRAPKYEPYAAFIEKLHSSCLKDRREAADKLIQVAAESPEMLFPVWDYIKELVETPVSESERKNLYDREEAGYHADYGIGMKFPEKPSV